MALIYKNQAYIEALARRVTGVTANPPRRTDMEVTLFADPGSGQKRKSDELIYYNNKNGDAAGVNKKITDAKFTFDAANGGNEPRADQAEHIFDRNGNFV
jgi:hypothetical protein